MLADRRRDDSVGDPRLVDDDAFVSHLWNLKFDFRRVDSDALFGAG